MDIPTWLIAIATVAIAWNAIMTRRAMQKNEEERSDLYRAIVISNLLCSPSGDNPPLYRKAKEKFETDYDGKTPIFKKEETR